MEGLRRTGLHTLRWLEQYTKTDMVYLAKGGFWTIFSQVITTISTLLLAVAFAHYVSKETYGEYKFILSIGSVLGAFTLSGLGTAVAKSISEGFEGTMNSAFWDNIKWSALFCVLALGVAIYYFVNGNNGIGEAILVLGALTPFFNSSNLYNSYLTAKKDFRRSALYFLIIGNVFPSVCLFLVILLHATPLVLIITYFVSNTLIGIFFYTRVLGIYRPNKKVDDGALRYSKHLSFMGILSIITENIDQILVFHYVGPVQLAIYNFAIAIPNQIKGPVKGLATLIFPKFTERSDREIVAGMNRKYLVMFLSSIVIIVTYIIAAPFIFHILFPKYVSSILYSQVFAFYFLGIISAPPEVYLLAKQKIKEQYVAALSGAFVQIILLFVGILWWGLIGLVVARVITKLIWSTTSIILYTSASRKAVQNA
jgi:O-antigen/teichoic acid export membrane protein